MNKLWLEETEKLAQDIKREYQVLAQEHEALGEKLAAKAEELRHWEAIILSYRKYWEVTQPSLPLQIPDRYKDLSHVGIILWVRDQCEGSIPMRTVTELLKGRTVNPQHATSVAYSTLSRLIKQGKVIKVRPGLYKWVSGAS
mgnify:CR=1 FL=1